MHAASQQKSDEVSGPTSRPCGPHCDRTADDRAILVCVSVDDKRPVGAALLAPPAALPHSPRPCPCFSGPFCAILAPANPPARATALGILLAVDRRDAQMPEVMDGTNYTPMVESAALAAEDA